LLSEKPDQPVTIDVHGDWGAGKSSMLEMIEAGFDGKDEVLCLKFNGWRFQGFEDAKIALIEGIVTGLVEKRPVLTKAAVAVKEVFRCVDWLKVAKRAGSLAITASTGMPSPDLVKSIIGSLEEVRLTLPNLLRKNSSRRSSMR
jgi:predicted KAP-like P-loop ATPase